MQLARPGLAGLSGRLTESNDSSSPSRLAVLEPILTNKIATTILSPGRFTGYHYNTVPPTINTTTSYIISKKKIIYIIILRILFIRQEHKISITRRNNKHFITPFGVGPSNYVLVRLLLGNESKYKNKLKYRKFHTYTPYISI